MTSSRSKGTFISGAIGLVYHAGAGTACQRLHPAGSNPAGYSNPDCHSGRVQEWRTRHRSPVGRPAGTVEIKKDATGNEYGMCTFKNGTSCEEWALFRGEGCKSGLTPAPTDAGKKMVTFTEADNGKTENVTQNTRFAVVLAENPSTGFSWNATLSPGLALQSDSYQDAASAGRVGAGGTHTWVIVGKVIGDQKFSAIYKRPWEPATGNETAYSVNIWVVKP